MMNTSTLKNLLSGLTCWMLIVAGWPLLAANAEDDNAPAWAFAPNPPAGTTPPADNGVARHVPGSTRAYTLTQIRDLHNPPDWHPDTHPPMPPVVAHGRKPAVFACGYCHLPNGMGRPENASLAGLPAAYIEQQMQDFKSGARRSSAPYLVPQAFMLNVAAAVDEQEIKEAARYFSSLQPKAWIRVEETDTVPKTRVKGWMLVEVPGAGNEPIGERVIEMPIDLERTELRDASSGFVAYVPRGSLARGGVLVNSGAAGRTIACTLCHGADLHGLGPVPALAGRSPSYLVRQLYDFQHGSRNGAWAALMKNVVKELTLADMVAIAAYAAAQAP